MYDMIYREEKRNLLEVPQGWWIAHCISGDFALGAGVARQIDETFDMKEMLNANWGDDPELLEENCCIPCGNVLNLVTKRKYWHKPTLDSLREALEDMRMLIEGEHIHKVAMPKIGCGLDRLNWDDVSPMIQDVFKNTDVEIMVCYL